MKNSALLFLNLITLIISFKTYAEPSLFKAFPALKNKIAHIDLCELPTPITKLEHFGNKLGYQHIYLKRDDLSGKRKDHKLYGGNKPRKLEWLLADALEQHAKTIITYGCAGSNHALATAVYAHELDLKTILMLKPQPNSDTVRQNLLLDFAMNAELRLFSDNNTRDSARKEIMANDPYAYFIPTGGSNAIGTLGFVNAAFELYEQIDLRVLPEPNIIYIPVGSCATAAGLILGMALNNSKTRIVAVLIEPENTPGAVAKRVKDLFHQTNQLLHNADNTIPLIDFPEQLFTVNTKFCGTDYGLWTQEATFAIQLFKDLEHITLDGTYSAKPINAFLDDLISQQITHEVVLIWNTYCGLDFSSQTKYSYKNLPSAFHEYFEQNVQVLNRIIT